MENKMYTAEEVVKATVEILSGIRVPISLLNEIATPISQAIQNLNVCIAAWQKAEDQKEEEPPIQIVEEN